MSRLIYWLERADSDTDIPKTNARTMPEDATVAVTMAALGLPYVRRQFFRSSEGLACVLSFRDEQVTTLFNLRVERALAQRGVRIRRIQVLDRTEHADAEANRAVA